VRNTTSPQTPLEVSRRWCHASRVEFHTAANGRWMVDITEAMAEVSGLHRTMTDDTLEAALNSRHHSRLLGEVNQLTSSVQQQASTITTTMTQVDKSTSRPSPNLSPLGLHPFRDQMQVRDLADLAVAVVGRNAISVALATALARLPFTATASSHPHSPENPPPAPFSLPLRPLRAAALTFCPRPRSGIASLTLCESAASSQEEQNEQVTSFDWLAEDLRDDVDIELLPVNLAHPDEREPFQRAMQGSNHLVRAPESPRGSQV
jgi:hypothetical protein